MGGWVEEGEWAVSHSFAQKTAASLVLDWVGGWVGGWRKKRRFECIAVHGWVGGWVAYQAIDVTPTHSIGLLLEEDEIEEGGTHTREKDGGVFAVLVGGWMGG